MPQDRLQLSVHVKEEDAHRTTECGMACGSDVEHLLAWLWGKDTSKYVLVVNDREYDLETTDDIREKVEGIIEFDRAFCQP